METLRIHYISTSYHFFLLFSFFKPHILHSPPPALHLHSAISLSPSSLSTAKEISELEGQLHDVRSLLNVQSSLIHSLTDRAPVSRPPSLVDPSLYIEPKEASAQEVAIVELPDRLSVFLAERRIEEALQLLGQGEEAVALCKSGRMQVSDALRMLRVLAAPRSG